MSIRRMLQSKVQFRAVDYAIGIFRDMMSDLARRVMVADHRDSTMLRNVGIQPLGYD